jgi:ribosome-binding factor A
MESTRQNKISRLIQKDLSEIFMLKAKDIFQGKLISVTSVRVTPDLAEAKVYISIFPSEKAPEIIAEIEASNKSIRHELAQKVRNQLRVIPELKFYIDDSLDFAQKIDDLLK